MWISEGHGGTIYSSVDQTNKMKTTNSKILVIFLAIIHDFFSEDQKIKEGLQSKTFHKF